MSRDKPLSKHMYGLLRFIQTYDVSLQHLRWSRQVTLWACGYRQYLAVEGDGSEESKVTLSKEGERVVAEYNAMYASPSMPTRSEEGDLSKRARAVLRLGQRIMRQERRAKKEEG